MTGDLVSRLNAELTRREEIAKKIVGIGGNDLGEWDVEGNEIWSRHKGISTDHIVVKWTWPHEAEFIAANDPAFVLRWVSGVRELVEWHGGRHVCEDQLVFRLDEPKWDEDDPDRKPCEVLKIVASMLGVEP